MENGKFITNQKPQITFLRDCLTVDNNIAKTKTKIVTEQQQEKKTPQNFKTDEHDFKYYEDIPFGWYKCEDFKEFYDLKDVNKFWGQGNIIPVPGKPYLIYSPNSNRYWYRETHSQTNYLKLLKYFKDKNIYTKKEDEI